MGANDSTPRRPDTPSREVTVEYRSLTTEAGQATEADVSAVCKQRDRNDVQALLHWRLQFLAYLYAGGLAISVAFNAATGYDFAHNPYTLLMIGAFDIGAGLAVALWVRRSFTLPQLRAVELILFGLLDAAWASVHAGLCPQMKVPTRPIGFGPILGCALRLPWSYMVVAYGILIPTRGGGARP